MLMIAFAGAHITLASQDYGSTLRTSLVLALLSVPCLFFSFRRGKIIVRILAVIGGIIVLLTLAEIGRRLF